MRLPREPQTGMQIAESIREIIRYLRAITLTSVTGGKLQQTSNGTTLAIDRFYLPPGSSAGGRFIVSLSGNDLSVSLGTVFFGDGGKDKRSYYPIEPTLDGVVLSENPSWDVTEKENDVLHKVWVVWSSYNYDARVELLPGDETPEYDTGENGLNIAEVTFSGEEESRTMIKAQLWESDISGWKGGEGDGSSDSGGGSSDGSGGVGSSDDSGIDDSSLGGSSESGSSESGSSIGVPCPVLSDLRADRWSIGGEVGANCFEDADDDGFPEGVYVVVNCQCFVSAVPPGCGGLAVKFSIGTGKGYYNLGIHWVTGNYTQVVPVSFFAFADSTYTVTAEIYQNTSIDGCDLVGCAAITTEITMPGMC